MEIKLYLRMLRRGWWIVLLTILVAVNIALLAAYFTRPIYRASARFSVSPNPSLISDGIDVITSLEALDKRSIIQTYAEFLNSNRIYQETLQAMNLTEEQLLAYKRATVVIPDANILELSFEGPDRQLTAALANNLGQNAIRHIKQLYDVYDINLLDPATVPTIPIQPQPLRNAVLASVIGLILGAALAIASEQIRQPIESYRYRASLDPVSGVYHRRYFLQQLEQTVSRNPVGVTSLGLVRLDGLTGLIDSLPQPVVQELLHEVSSILNKELRGNDLIGRWNDSTYALLLPSTPEQAASRTMERIRLALLNPIVLEDYGETMQLDPFISVASYRPGDTSSALVQRAEDALERSPQSNTDLRNRI